MLLKLRLCAMIALGLAAGIAGADESHRGHEPAPPKVILDTDFNTISDDGQGFCDEAPAVHRRGISGSIVARTEGAGGRATVTSSPGKGTTVRLEFPHV